MSSTPALPDWHHAATDGSPIDRAVAQRWLDAYVAAWISYDEAAIGDLWTEDAVWFYPFGVRARGRAAITAEWMAEAALFVDGGYDARYEPIAIDPPFVVSHGRTRFFDPASGRTVKEFDNVWVLRFGPDGRCSEFHEWFAPDTETGEPAAGGTAPEG